MVTMRIVALQIILLIFSVQSSLAQANYTCAGPVTGLAISPAGLVTAESMAGFSWVYVCQFGTNYNGVLPRKLARQFTRRF